MNEPFLLSFKRFSRLGNGSHKFLMQARPASCTLHFTQQRAASFNVFKFRERPNASLTPLLSSFVSCHFHNSGVSKKIGETPLHTISLTLQVCDNSKTYKVQEIVCNFQ